MTSLHAFLTARKKTPQQVQTHTWFGAGPENNRTVTLHIDPADVPLMRKLLVAEVSKGKSSGERPSAASITEKITRGVPFRFAVDLDFKPQDVKTWAEARGYTDPKIIFARLRKKLRDVVQLLRSVVGEMVGDVNVHMVLSSRLPYKDHVHFPDVIVDSKTARAICTAFSARFATEHSDLFSTTVVDSSVYGTGLRLPYCHKGGMTTVAKRNAELAEHEALFGTGTYCDVYYITDLDTWEQKRTPCVQDLESTSLHCPEGTALTELYGVSNACKTKASKGKGKGKEKDRVATTKNGSKEMTPTTATESPSTLDAELVEYLSDTFTMSQTDIHMEKKSVQGGRLVVPTRCKDCPFIKKRHRGNQLYFVISPTSVELRCHDENCNDSVTHALPEEVSIALFSAPHPTETELRDRRQDLMTTSFQNIRELHPLVEITDEDITALDTVTNLGGIPGFIRPLSTNKWCPICNRYHDAPENCIYTTVTAQQLVCNKALGNAIGLPFDKEKVQLVFNIQVVNHNVVNNYGSDSEVLRGPRNFGSYDDFPKIYEDAVINRLCFESIVTGATYQVSNYVSKIVSKSYIFVERKWYKFIGTRWTNADGPDAYFANEIVAIYLQLMHTYCEPTQVKMLQILVSDLSNKNKRKPYIEELEGILQESGDDPIKLDGNPTLFSFRNGTYDSASCSFRKHLADDYVTTLLPYDFPDQSDPIVRKEIHAFFEEIMPNPDTRRFLLTYLALHLEGRNRHQIAVILAGNGGNGKSIVMGLMKAVFGHLQATPTSPFLTNERPSDERPCPNVMALEKTCCLFISEPEDRKKINGAFLKFLCGNDMIRGRSCNQNEMREFMPRFIPTLLCNTIPLIDCGATESRSLWRRLRIIYFPTQYMLEDEVIRHAHQRRANTGLYKHVTENWGPEMMLFLTEIFADYVANCYRLHVPPEVVECIQDQQQANDPFGQWCEENLLRTADSSLHVHRIVDEYSQHLLSLSEADRELPVSSRDAVKRLAAAGHRIQPKGKLNTCTQDCRNKKSSVPIVLGVSLASQGAVYKE